MRHTAVVEFIGNFSEIKLIIYKQFFYSFDLVNNDKMFNSGSLYFGKKVREIGIIVI